MFRSYRDWNKFYQAQWIDLWTRYVDIRVSFSVENMSQSFYRITNTKVHTRSSSLKVYTGLN